MGVEHSVGIRGSNGFKYILFGCQNTYLLWVSSGLTRASKPCDAPPPAVVRLVGAGSDELSPPRSPIMSISVPSELVTGADGMVDEIPSRSDAPPLDCRA